MAVSKQEIKYYNFKINLMRNKILSIKQKNLVV